LPIEPLHNEKELLSRLAAGDEAAYKELLRAYWNPIYSLAFAYLKSPEQAEDAVQETFLKLWDKRASLAAIEKFNDWLFITTRNHIVSVLRKKIAAPLHDGLSQLLQQTYQQPDTLAETNQTRQLLHKAIALLPERRRMIFLLSRQEGLSYEQIAEKLNISRIAVKGQIAQALIFLREYLARNSDTLISLSALLATASALY
jgi:RNA polymerase sigma-70 factor (family 1)